MAYYLMQVSYTSEAWVNMVENPQDRLGAVQRAIESLGGKLEGGWMSFGEYDAVVVFQMPDNISAAAFSIAALVGGAVKASKTTPLLTFEEGIKAMKKEADVKYQPPKR